MFELHIVQCSSKNGYQEDMCFKEIGLHAKKDNNHSRLDSHHDWEGGKGPTRPFMKHKNIHFDNEEAIHMSFEIMRKVATTHILLE